MYIISACLLGENVKYSGGNNYSEAVCQFLKDKSFMAVCPETEGGLPVPRTPSERVGEKVLDKTGRDVTAFFEKGARRCLEKILEETDPGEIEGAILKARSPSCGSGEIYDGSFSGITVRGDGVFTELLRSKGIPVYTELDLVKDKSADKFILNNK